MENIEHSENFGMAGQWDGRTVCSDKTDGEQGSPNCIKSHRIVYVALKVYKAPYFTVCPEYN